MARFSELGVDLVYVIFSHLQSDKAELRQLALSCRLFRDIAQRFIVRDASISHSLNRSRTKLFLRTLTERPDLVVHVRKLELDLLREDIHWPEEQHIIHQITRRLTNLREFCYLSRDYKVWHYSVPQPLKWGREYAHDQIRRVEWHHNMDPWELSECMELPRIESIRVRKLHDNSLGCATAFKIPARKHRTSSLKELHIGSPGTLAYDVLRILLYLPRCLKKITLDSRDVYQSVIEPAALVPLLEPVRDSLEELYFEVHNNMLPPPAQAVDLSSFPSLKKLSLPFRYIFGRKAVESYQVDALLPPLLSNLTVSFKPERASKNPSSTLSSHFEALFDWMDSVDRQEGVPVRMPSLTHIVLQKKDHLSPVSDQSELGIRLAMERFKPSRLSVGHCQ